MGVPGPESRCHRTRPAAMVSVEERRVLATGPLAAKLKGRGRADAVGGMGISTCKDYAVVLYLLFPKLGCATVAQWQSTGFVNQMLWVQVPPVASRKKGTAWCRTATGPGTEPPNQQDACPTLAEGAWRFPRRIVSDPLSSGSAVGRENLHGLPAGRWPSGQWHQTVNLADFVLRRFESCSAHS